MKVNIHITLKEAVLDPQGQAIGNALIALGFQDVEAVRQGKFIELWIDEKDTDRARERSEEMCRQLLANPVIEAYRIDVEA